MQVNKKGFTLIEILVVIGIMTTVFLFSDFIFASRQSLVGLDMASSKMLSILRQAQNQSLSRKASSSWGVYFDEARPSVYTVYAGNDFQNRKVLYDIEVDMGETITWSIDFGTSDILFSSINGFPLASTTITIKYKDFSESKKISINEIGKIERDD